MQRVLHCGREQLKARIVDRVAQDVVELSMDKFGCFVVEECFLSMGLQRVLDAFLGLSDDDLAVTVQGRYSNYVVQMLLEAGKKVSTLLQTVILIPRSDRQLDRNS